MTSPNPDAIDTDTLSGMTPLSKVVYSLGSNLGDRLANLQGGVDAIGDTPGIVIADISAVYETRPIGGPADSPDYLNLVIVAETTLEPRTLLERALAIEDALGRERSPVEAAPRTLDVDLITVGTTVASWPGLELPHPRAAERGFVLVPWAEIDPNGELPGLGPVADLVAAVHTSGIRRRDDLRIAGD